ncbi:hypothetical protein ACERIT_00310 [Halopenitus sp. H-Gu1]|uniref:DUF7536 family protein n=1 Tax=Halopenitus sp. H-Gu1 TaxID=3242697 RepID=UPI00359EC09C
MSRRIERFGVTEKRPERPPLVAFLAALEVRRHAIIGAIVGIVVAVAAYLFRVLELWGPFDGTRAYPVLGPEGWFLLLAFVLAVACGTLVTVALTVRSAIARSREIADER